jgi:predicted chitinase
MASKVTSINAGQDAKSTFFIVDPNPPGRDIVPPEDLFMYVKFSVRTKRRSIIGIDNSINNSGSLGEIDFISTKVEKDSETQKILNNGVSYATTDWTDIGGVRTKGAGVLEGFGIQSISINYGASLVPQVDIKFTDLRGAALFDGISSDSESSLYSIFFKLPYPVFELTVKGYFGKPVTYCLHLVNWNSDFDGSSGNFNINAKFVGFQQAFLADMVMQNVISCVNTAEGLSELEKLTIKDINGVEKPTPKLDTFLSDINKLDSDIVKSIKEKSPAFEELKSLNTKLEKIKAIRNYVGAPIPKNSDNTNENEYSVNVVNTESIGGGLRYNIDYLSIRDFIIIKGIFYSDQNKGNNSNDLDQKKTFDTYFINFNRLITDFNTDYPNELSASISNTTEDIVLSQIIGQNGLIVNDSEKFKQLEGFNSADVIIGDYVGVGKFSSDGSDIVRVYNLFDVRVEIEKKYNEILEDKKEKEKEFIDYLNIELAKKLDFDPKMRDIFTIIMNNIQAMLTTIYNVAKKASDESIKQKRIKAIRDKRTDIKDGAEQVYPFPDVANQSEGSTEEITWLGDFIKRSDYDAFPEIDFVENSIRGYIRTNRIFNDTAKLTKFELIEGWLPINPTDTTEIPYKNLSWNRLSGSGISGELIETILKRLGVIVGFSEYNDRVINQVGYLEGSFCALEILDEKYRNIIDNNINIDDIIDYGISNNIISNQGVDEYVLTDDPTDNLTFGATNISLYKEDTDYIYISNNCNNSKGDRIINNSILIDYKISDIYSSNIIKIEEDKSFDNLKSNLENVKRDGIKYFNKGNLLPHQNLSFIVWGQTIQKNLGVKRENFNSGYKLTIDNINKIDGKTTSLVQTNQSKNNYIGILNTQPSAINPKYLIDSDLYSGQTQEGKALLMLNTLPFDNPKVILKHLTDNSKVVELPNLYMIWLGGTLWRYTQVNGLNVPSGATPAVGPDPIVWGTTPSVSSNQLLSNIGRNVYTDDIVPVEFLNLPNSVKETLIGLFTSWVSSGKFTEFEGNVASYTESVVDSDQNNNKIYGDYLARILSEEISLITLTPDIWRNVRKSDITFTRKQLTDFLDKFTTSFRKFNTQVVTPEQQRLERVSDDKEYENTINDKNIKIAFYKFYKNVYDKWIAGTTNGKIFNTCVTGSNDRNLIDYFNFIDRGWNDIGDIAAINLNSLTTLINNPDTNAYFYIAKILRDSNFILQILPSYINFKDENEVKKMFEPVTELENSNSGPAYVCIKAGGNSKNLDIKDIEYRYKDDRMDFNNPNSYKDIVRGTKGKDFNELNYNLVAFRVAFGAENQSIFKNVSLNQEEHRETGEYFKVLADLVDRRGGTQKSYVGNDLYKAFSVRSYKCDIESLGCMNIQPLMYFQLDNVPFFKGAYLITNVNHDITPNHITTNFSGLRQSSVTLPTVTETTAYINLDLDELNEGVSTPELIPPQRNILSFGAEDPESNFNFEAKTTTSNLISIGFVPDFVNDLSSSEANTLIRDTLTSFGITTNAQVSMFFAQLAYESRNGRDKEEVWNNPDCGGGNTTQLAYSSPENTLGNDPNTTDGYEYRKRGYISILGKTEYTDANGDTRVNNNISPQNSDILLNPDIVINSPLNSLVISAYKWSQLGLTSLTKGSGAQFAESTKFITGSDVVEPDRSSTFEKVLNVFQLLDKTNV